MVFLFDFFIYFVSMYGFCKMIVILEIMKFDAKLRDIVDLSRVLNLACPNSSFPLRNSVSVSRLRILLPCFIGMILVV